MSTKLHGVTSQKVKTVTEECASRSVGDDRSHHHPVLYRRATRLAETANGFKRSATSTNCGLPAERRPRLCCIPAPYSGRSQVPLPTCRRCIITEDSHGFPEPSKANAGTLHQSHRLVLPSDASATVHTHFNVVQHLHGTRGRRLHEIVKTT
jgi:hypothetical protein